MSRRFQKVDPVRRSHGHAILTGNPSRTSRGAVAPPELRGNQKRCPVCRNGVATTVTGKLRKHVDLFGADCYNRNPGDLPPIGEVPPVVLPRVRDRQAGAQSRTARPDEERPPSRLDAGSECRECGKWLPGERSLCGRCYATGGR